MYCDFKWLRASLRPANAFGHVCVMCTCLCLSVSPVCALTFESLDLEISFLVCWYIFRISRSSLYVKVVWSRSQEQEIGHTSVTRYSLTDHKWSAFDCKTSL